MERTSTEQINKFLRSSDKRADTVVSELGKDMKFMSALESDVGQELLMDVAVRMEAIVGKIINEESTPEQRAEFRALRSIAKEWFVKINKYQSNIEKVNAA